MGVTTGNAKPFWGNGHYYVFTKESASWYDAVSRSNVLLPQLNSNGYLATITSADENTFITNYSYAGSKIPNSGFLSGTDDNGQGTSEGTWIWKGGPEAGSTFRSSNTNRLYTNWNSGEPNNHSNQDFLQIYTSGYWDDVDPDNVGGYVTEWGRSGAQFSINFSSNPPTNAFEGSSNGSVRLHLDHAVYSDYTYNGTALIDIPLTLGGSAIYDTDYTVSVSGGASSYNRSTGKLYILGSSGSPVQDVTITILPINNTNWKAPRDVTISLGADGSENIYSLSGSTSQRLWIFDDEPSLSLGQGLSQSIFTNYTSTGSNGSLPASADTTIFDTNGINENDGTFDDYGLYDNFGIRWEGYVRIPDTGTYTFNATSDDGVKLTLRQNNSSGTLLDSLTRWVDQGATTISSKALTLNKGDVVWLQMDYYENGGGASAQLSWTRTPSGGSPVQEVIPASALFLSEAVARGRDRTEPSSGDTTSAGFTVFANKSYGSSLNVQLNTSTASGNTTVNNSNAQQRTSNNSTVGDDYGLYSDAAGTQLLGANPSFTWQPTSTSLSKDLYLKVYSDIYAETSEGVTLTLANNSNSSYANYGIASASLKNTIADQPMALSLGSVQNAEEGNQGWVEISTNGTPVTNAGGLRVKYTISGGSATRDVDFYAPKATLSTTNYAATDYVYLPMNSTGAKLYITALKDAISEGNETVNITLQTNVETNDNGFTYQLYNVDNTRSTATLTISDGSAFQPGVVITPQGRTGNATIRASLVNGQQQASFDLHLLSQPLADVTVHLTSSSGNLSTSQLIFTASNWDQPQSVTLSNQRTDQITTVTASTSSNDSHYASSAGLGASQPLVPSSWPSDLGVTLWEGGSSQQALPIVSVTPKGATEGSNSDYGFDLSLSETVASKGLEVFYSLSAGAGFQLNTSNTSGGDALFQPQRQYNPLTLASGGTGFVNLGSLSTVGSQGRFSAEAWVRLDATGTASTVLDFADGAGRNEIQLGFQTNSAIPQLSFWNANGQLIGTVAASSAIPLGQWSHLAFSVDANRNASLYVDGSLVGSGLLSEALSTKTRSSNWVGRSAAATDANNGYLHGAVHDVRIWNGSRTADQIQSSLLRASASGSDLVGAYSLNNSLANAVAGGPTAALNNGATFATTPFYGVVVPVEASSVSLRLSTNDDLLAEGNESLALNVIGSSRYSITGSSGTGSASLADNDTAEVLLHGLSGNGVWIETSALQVSEGDQASGTLTPLGLSLATQPTSTVTLAVIPASFSASSLKVLTSDGSANAGSLTFTPDNWSTVQQLMLQGVDNTNSSEDVSQLLSFSVSGNDGAYTALAPSLSVTTLDNDPITASTNLAVSSSSTAPIASLGAPSVGVLQEGSSSTSTFTISLSAPASSDTLVFLDVERFLSQVDPSDVQIGAVTEGSVLSGLTLLQQSGSQPESSSVDGDGINENGSSFQNKGLSGSFKTTWSGYLFISETGTYSFKTAVQGGVKLTVNDTTLIDRLFDQQGTLTADGLDLEAGSVVPITLDYASYNSQEPKISLSWIRPDQGGTADVEEVVPSSAFSRADGLHLIIPQGATSVSFSLRSLDDQVAEGQSSSLRQEDLVLSLLEARGQELTVEAQSAGSNGQSQLSLRLSQTDRESVTLAAGTVLNFGQNLDSSSSALAAVTLQQGITLHRDRSNTVLATVTVPGSSTAYTNSLVGLVSSVGTGSYQVLDPGVNLIARSNWVPDTEGAASGNGQIQLALEATNRGSITLPSGSQLFYQSSAADGTNTPLMGLTLLEPLSLSVASGESSGAATTVRVKADNYSSTSTIPNLIGLSSAYSPSPEAKLSINDNDTPGILISSDAAGKTLVSSSNLITLQEAGSSLTRYLHLSSQPTQTVTVYLETSDSSEGLLQKLGSTTAASSRLSLTFSPENWATPQGFQVTPVDDNLVDGSVAFTIEGRTVSTDSFYAISSTGTALSVSTADNDQPSLKLELVQSSISRGSNGFLSVRLSAEPTAPVTITLTPSDSQFTINDRSIGRPETLTFSPDTWAAVQQVELRAVDDSAIEDVSRSSLSFSTSSSDSRFNNLSVEPATVDIVDNDLPTASIQLVSNSSEEAQAGSFRISLSAPAPSSAGSDGVVVHYTISNVSVDPRAGYPSSSSTISLISQAPGASSGSVRIAPGQSSSDVFVVPIDDFLADATDKSFQVNLSSGTGYQLANGSTSNSATVKIINNDKAGLVIITSGERALVSEGSGTGQFQIALLSQPGGNVTIQLSELLAAGAARQLGNSQGGYSGSYTFTPSNWYVPQVVNFTGWDDNLIEDGSGSNANTGLHSTQLQYAFTSSDSDYNSSSHSGDSSHFTNTIQTVDVMDRQLPSTTSSSINSALTSLQEGLDSLALPMVGSLDGKTGLGIRKFLNELVNSISAAGTPTPKKLQKLIADGIGISQNAVSVSMKGTDVEVSFQFSDQYSVFSVPLDANLGLPGLGFKSEGSLDADFSYDARVDMVFPLSGEIYLNTDPAKTYFNANYTTSLSPDFSLSGGLGFLQLDAVNQPSVNADIIAAKGDAVSTGLNVDFSLDVSGGAGSDQKLTFSELTSASTSFEDLFRYSFTGDAALSLGVTTSVNGSAAIPSFHFDLSSLLPLFDYSNQDQADDPEAATNFYFDNIRLDLGTYITGMLTPVVDGIDSILNPLYPIVDALYANTKIFDTIGIANTFDENKDGIVSPIDLAQWFANLYAALDPVRGKQLQATIDATVKFLDIVKGVMDLVRSLEQMAEEGDFYIDYGNYTLPAYQAGNENKSTTDVSVDDSSTTELSKDTGSKADSGGTDSNGKSSNSFSAVMKQLDELGFSIPLIDDPKNVVKLLLGQTVDLFTWRMPSMGMESSIEQDFYIYPGIDGIIEGGFGVDATIGFGFDTYGLNEWRNAGFKSSDAWKVFDGFYVADRNSDNVDIPEFTLDASMGAGLGLSAVVAKASITGGLEASASFDLLDEGEVAGTADGKIRGQEISSRIDTPLELFTLIGDLSAYLQAKVQVGLDMGFYSIWDTVWQEKLATIPIFEFGVGGSYGSGTASNGYIQGGIVFWDGNSNGRRDSTEPWTTTGADAHFRLKIDHRSYDTNGNGVLDPNEGRFVLIGGTDSSTGQGLSLPMVAPFGQMITPVTTLYTMGLDLGYSSEALHAWLTEAFQLEGFDVLQDDPMLDLNNQTSAVPGGTLAQRAYLAHIKLHFTLNIVAQALQDLLPELLPNTSQAELTLVQSFVAQLLAEDPSLTINQRLAQAIRATATALGTDLSSDLQALLSRVGDLAAAASWELVNQLDERLASVRDQTGAQVLEALNDTKTRAFQHFNTNTDRLAEGLHLLNGEALLQEVERRLDQVQAAYIDQVDGEPQQGDQANATIPASLGWGTERLKLTPVSFEMVDAYQERGHQLGRQAVDFSLLRPLSTLTNRTSVLLNLSLLDPLDDRANRTLSWFSGADAASMTGFLYDPNTLTGTRFFNLGSGSGSLVADVAYVDNQRGDLAAQTDGQISDPGLLSLFDLQPQLEAQGPVLQIGDPSTQEPAAVFARVAVQERAASSNQVGYLLLRGEEAVDSRGLPTIDLGQLVDRFQVLLGSLERTGVAEQSDPNQYARALQVSNRDRLVLLEVQDGILSDLARNRSSIAELGSQLQVLTPSVSGSTATYRGASGLTVTLELAGSEPGLGALLARQQHQAPLLDFTGLGTQAVTGSLEVTREAAYGSVMGWYRVLDQQGTVANPVVVDGVSGQPLSPGDPGYLEAALAPANRVTGLDGLSGSQRTTITLTEGGLLAPYAIVDDPQRGRLTYIGFAAGNPDQQQHFQVLGDGVIGLEDLFGRGDGDFDDKLMSFRPTGLVPTSSL